LIDFITRELTTFSDKALLAGTLFANPHLLACTPRSGSENMKSAILAGVMTVAIGTAAFANGLYWVVGNRATNKCEIVTSNPVIYPYGGGDLWFGDGPYQSVDDAKLARSTIRVCPEAQDEPRAECDGRCEQQN
jgi:hypothetical protein